MKPILLNPNPIQHFYRGGDRIAALRGIVAETDHQPEEWLGATVTRFGSDTVGLADTPDGVLRDIVAQSPERWFGGIGSGPSDTGLLVKLLDARQRLPVHVHPSRGFSLNHLDCPYGKTEAWYVLDADPGSAVYVGWKEPVDREELDRRRDAQDSQWMLDHLNRIPAREGMGVLCPAGTAHAIGEGVFVAEVQEPTDFSILLEWSVTTSTREESHLDVGFDTAMQAVSTDAVSKRELESLVSEVGVGPATAQPQSLLPAEADPYFRVLRAASEQKTGRFPQSFAVVLVTAGSGRLVSDSGAFDIRQGEAAAVPFEFGSWVAEGDLEVIAHLPGAGWPLSLPEGRLR